MLLRYHLAFFPLVSVIQITSYSLAFVVITGTILWPIFFCLCIAWHTHTTLLRCQINFQPPMACFPAFANFSVCIICKLGFIAIIHCVQGYRLQHLFTIQWQKFQQSFPVFQVIITCNDACHLEIKCTMKKLTISSLPRNHIRTNWYCHQIALSVM